MTLAVVAAQAAGVLNAPAAGEAVGGLMQQGAEHVGGAALEAFAADQHLGSVGWLVGELPAAGGEVP